MPADPPRYAEDPTTQRLLAEQHAQAGGNTSGCHKRTCYVCGRVFYAGMPHARLCSERCNQDATLARRRAARARGRRRRCPRCGTVFVARRRDAVYCSNACRQAAYRQRQARRPALRLRSLRKSQVTLSVTGPSRPPYCLMAVEPAGEFL